MNCKGKYGDGAIFHNKPLFILVSVNAVLTGLSVAINGAPFDYLYALAGLTGIVMMAKYFREIFMKKKI